jgi:hypothetical protein
MTEVFAQCLVVNAITDNQALRFLRDSASGHLLDKLSLVIGRFERRLPCFSRHFVSAFF